MQKDFYFLWKHIEVFIGINSVVLSSFIGAETETLLEKEMCRGIQFI